MEESSEQNNVEQNNVEEDIKSRSKRKKKSQRVEESSEQNNVEGDLHPLHARWKFTRKELEELKSKGTQDVNLFSCNAINVHVLILFHKTPNSNFAIVSYHC